MIFGLVGKKGSGKDTVAHFLAKRYCVERTAFAAPLKEAAQVIFGLSDRQVNGTIEDKETVDPRWGLTPREIMQRLGTEVGRGICEDVWVRRCRQRIEESARPRFVGGVDLSGGERRGTKHWAITDVRFPNEAAMVRDLGGVIVLVRRPVDPGVGSAHASERFADEVVPDWTIDNCGTLADLDNEAIRLFREMVARAERGAA